MTAIDGKTLASCFQVASKAGQELEVMSERLADLLRDAIEGDRALPVTLSQGGSYEEWPSRDSDDQWVSTDIAFNLPLKLRGPGRRSVDRYVGFQISMIGDGIAIPGNDEPLLHMFAWADAVPIGFEGDDECYVGFPFEDDEEQPFEVKGDRIITWTEAGQESIHSWNYSLRLMKLKDEQALRRYCISPTLKLLGGSSIVEALPDSFFQEGVLVKLPSKGALCGREDNLG